MKRVVPLLFVLAAALPLCRAQAPPSWTITVSPTSAVAGSPGVPLTVTGTYASSATVRWNGTALSCKYTPSTFGPGYLTCSVPSSFLAAPGSASIQADAYVSPSQAFSNVVTFTILAPLAVTTACPMPDGTLGAPYSLALTASGGATPYYWSISAGSLPRGLSLTGGAVSGTPTALGTYNFTILVSDTYQRFATKACTITVVSALAISGISPTSTAAGCGGTVLTIVGTGFLPGTITAGSVVEFSSPATGTQLIRPSSVTSTQVQVSIPDSFVANPGTATIRVVNPGGLYSNAVNFTVSPGPLITAIDPLGANTGAPEFTLVVRGSGFVAPSLGSGSLVQFVTPGGAASTLATTFVTDIELRAQVPASLLTAAGMAQVAVINPPCSVRSNLFPFEILERLQILNTSLPDGVVGTPYTAPLQATGGKLPYSFSVTGNLPGGLRFTSSTGIISGTPTTAGTFPVTVGVRDSANNFASRDLSITVSAGLSITTGSPLPSATLGVAYSQPLSASGGTTPYTWSATGLPAWLTLNSSSGALTGTPTTPGAIDFTVMVTDAAGTTATRSFALTIRGGVSITTASPLPAATAGVAYGQTLSATGGIAPYTWEAPALPGWLTLNASTGALTGIPATPATHEFAVRVTDSARNTATKTFSLTVNPGAAALTITTASPLPAGMVTVPYSQPLAATGGTTPYRWSVSSGGLPQGLSLNAASGVLGGTPTATGTANFTIQVTDSGQRTASKAFALTVSSAPGARFSGVGDSVQPMQQPALQLNLPAALATPITGQLMLSFAPDAVNPIDNPEVAFAAGGQRVNFTIPAGQTRAVFGTAQEMGIQVGTVAGTITVTAPPLTGSMVTRIARQAPTISSVRVTRTSSGFDVEIIGYATPRSVTSAGFTFTATGADLQTPTVTVNVDSAFTTWYRTTASNPFGSQFRYVQPFTVSGQATAVNSVVVTLTNANGASAGASASF